MDTSIAEFRASCTKSARRYSRMAQGVSVTHTTLGEVPAEWLMPQGAPEGKAILYVHGGGYVSGSCEDHRGFISRFARRTGYQTLTFSYRLAPEHPWPAAVEDGISVYRALMQSGFLPGNILFAGESAGGGLTLAQIGRASCRERV